MNIIIINGPNLNLLGKREKSIYGNEDFEQYFDRLKNKYPNAKLTYFQSNVEGEIVTKIQEANNTYEGIILNAAAYTHTSVAIADAVAAIEKPVIEVHISNILNREKFRHTSLIAPKCIGSISGLGLASYELALQYFIIINS